GVPEHLYWVRVKGGAKVARVGAGVVEEKMTAPHDYYTRIGKVGDSSVEDKITDRRQAVVNLMAMFVTFVITGVLVKGIQESAGFNALMVFIKVAAVIFVILVGSFYIHPENWRPFAPKGWTGFGIFGYHLLGQTNEAGQPVG